jgi:hypothetical protein
VLTHPVDPLGDVCRYVSPSVTLLVDKSSATAIALPIVFW